MDSTNDTCWRLGRKLNDLIAQTVDRRLREFSIDTPITEKISEQDRQILSMSKVVFAALNYHDAVVAKDAVRELRMWDRLAVAVRDYRSPEGVNG